MAEELYCQNERYVDDGESIRDPGFHRRLCSVGDQYSVRSLFRFNIPRSCGGGDFSGWCSFRKYHTITEF